MGQVRHGSATTTERRSVGPSKRVKRAGEPPHGATASARPRCRSGAHARPAPMRTGPREPHSSVLSLEEAVIVAFRRHTPLPLDDCLYGL